MHGEKRWSLTLKCLEIEVPSSLSWINLLAELNLSDHFHNLASEKRPPTLNVLNLIAIRMGSFVTMVLMFFDGMGTFDFENVHLVYHRFCLKKKFP